MFPKRLVHACAFGGDHGDKAVHALGMGYDHGQSESGSQRRLKLLVAEKAKPALSFLHSMVNDTVRSVGYLISSVPSLLWRQS